MVAAVARRQERLEELSHSINVNFPGAGNTHNSDVCWVLQSHRTCQIRGRIPSEITAKCNNDRFKILSHFPSTSFLPSSQILEHAFQQRFHLTQDLIVLIPAELNGFGRALRATDAATVAKGFIDFTDTIGIDLGNIVRT